MLSPHSIYRGVCGTRDDVLLVQVTELRRLRRRHEVGDEPGLAPAVRALGDERLVHEPLVHDHVEHRQQQIEIRPRSDLQVHVGQLRGLRPARIHDDQRARGILRSLFQHHARTLEAVAHPGVRAEDQQQLGFVNVGLEIEPLAPEDVAIDPVLLRKFLSQRVEVPGRADEFEQAVGIDVVQVVRLPAASHEAHGPAAAAGDDVVQLLGDLGDRFFPRDRPVAPVRHALERLEDTLIVMRVLRDREPLATRVAATEGVRAIPLHLADPVVLDSHP